MTTTDGAGYLHAQASPSHTCSCNHASLVMLSIYLQSVTLGAPAWHVLRAPVQAMLEHDGALPTAQAPHAQTNRLSLFHLPVNWFWSRPRYRSAGQAVASSLGRVPERSFPPRTRDKRVLILLHAATGRVPGGERINLIRLPTPSAYETSTTAGTSEHAAQGRWLTACIT